MIQQKRNILVTSALPYANAPLHLGHLLEIIQTDIWVRFQKLRGHQVTYCCADDAHGTPIMLKAEEEGLSPQQLIDKIHKSHVKDCTEFLVVFDNFYTTHSEENEELLQEIYNRLYSSGYISEKIITQSYDSKKEMFLPDRFVKGTCPKCKAEDQYGDNCESCGAIYSPTDLINPKSVLSGSTPIEKKSNHYFFELPKLERFLKKWLEGADIQSEIKNKMQEWFDSGLNSWDISRDSPYWGFKIPNADDKYFYVWLDAPIGYMASFKNYCNSNKNTNNIVFSDYFYSNKDDSNNSEIYHFIGKDIAYFHTLFWPSTLEGAGYRTPTGVYCHGFLTINGKKMSKSRGTFIKAETYLKHLNPENLRYYFASKLSARIEDIDLNLKDFMQKNNSDIVGKLVNLASRNAGFIKKRFSYNLSSDLDSPFLFTEAAKIIEEEIAGYYEKREYSNAIRKIMYLADKANEYIDSKKTWVLAKDKNNESELHRVCTTGINLFYQLIVVLQPVLPRLADNALSFLNINNVGWNNIKTPLTNHKINSFKPLAKRIEDSDIENVLKEGKEALNISKTAKNNNSCINIDQFDKIDLRVAKVVSCSSIDGADKLLKFKLDVGELGERQVFSGIKKYYSNPSDLIGKKLILVANLSPRKMKFGLSEGMILSSENDDSLFLLTADENSSPGDKVK